MMDVADRPKTVGILREDHLALMTRWREIADDSERVRLAAELRRRVKEAGHDIADPLERDEAQGIVDYWASAISSLPGQSYPEILTLDPYVGEAAKRAGDSARTEFDELASEEERRVARELFEDLLYLGPDGNIERGPPRTRAVLQQRIHSDTLDSVLERFVVTGAIARLPGEGPEGDRFEASDPRLVEDWPALREWLEELGEFFETRSRLLAQAERWREANRDSGLLARGKQVHGIDRFLRQTDLLDEFIDASTRSARIRRSISAGAITLVLAFAAVMTWQLVGASNQVRKVTDLLQEQEEQYAVEPETVAIDSLEPTEVDAAAVSLKEATGAVWLGSVERPQIAEVDGKRASPDRAADGSAYRVLADIYLRDKIPGDDYVSPPEKAIIPAGSLIVVQGETRPFDRPSGRQYWAKVRVVPRVYIQYTNGDRRAVQALLSMLAETGFDVPPAERTESATGLSEVRYFNELDRGTGQYLVDRLRASGRPAFEDLGCQSFANSRLEGQNFVVELWIDFRHQRAEPSRVEC
jgi:hypothetical protein